MIIFKIWIEENSSKNGTSFHTSISDLTRGTQNSTVEDDANPRKGGRPSSSTNSYKQQVEQVVVEMKKDIAQEYEREYEKFKKEGERMKPGQLKEIIDTHIKIF